MYRLSVGIVFHLNYRAIVMGKILSTSERYLNVFSNNGYLFIFQLFINVFSNYL